MSADRHSTQTTIGSPSLCGRLATTGTAYFNERGVKVMGATSASVLEKHIVHLTILLLYMLCDGCGCPRHQRVVRVVIDHFPRVLVV